METKLSRASTRRNILLSTSRFSFFSKAILTNREKFHGKQTNCCLLEDNSLSLAKREKAKEKTIFLTGKTATGFLYFVFLLCHHHHCCAAYLPFQIENMTIELRLTVCVCVAACGVSYAPHHA